ncbi:MAG: PfaD family polyunsaturated fatty acid/polyketide biosynthesis protein [Chloroflexi bacterium]|nr:PfaD family polyunsaturated fatty acid/polyketide biosynthesis protein [Chloroflexota bacterium]
MCEYPLINKTEQGVKSTSAHDQIFWHGSQELQPFSQETLSLMLRDFTQPVVLLQNKDQMFISSELAFSTISNDCEVLSFCYPFSANSFGDPAFRKNYGVKYPLYGGAMANGISSTDFVIALGKAGFMGSFGAGGLLPQQIELAILKIQASLTEEPYLFNLINSPFEPSLEERSVELYLKYGIHAIEASAYLAITNNLVHYRTSGLSQKPDGSIQISNRVIAKVSRKEVASKFLEPAPAEILNRLMEENKITEEQARLALLVPMADDITVEADSGGHTDNRPFVSILPAIIRLRDQIQTKRQYSNPVRIGAAGGIATPEATLAAFMMGAAYVVTGSVNQACVEAGASTHTKKLLSGMEMTDVAMAPAGDMFEMGVKVQVLKRGTMFAMRAQKLFEIYSRYESINEIPIQERSKLESSIFKMPLDAVWEECKSFFSLRDPKQIESAEQKPKSKMALIFRWYLGLSSHWSNVGEKGREIDYQIWCGPSMGAFNDWVRGSYLEDPENRRTADVAIQILQGAAYLNRINILESHGIRFAQQVKQYLPKK